MKRLIYILACCCLLSACSGSSSDKGATQTQQSANTFGKAISEDGAITIDQLITQTETSKVAELPAKVAGEVTAVCQKKGCWMNLKRPDGKEMRVTFKDYGFFMPTDCAGKHVVIEGIAKMDTTDVEMLRHFAEDEGLSPEEIAKITEPEVELTFIADGVILK